MDEDRIRQKIEDLKKRKESRGAWKDFWGPKPGPNEIRILPSWTGDLNADFFYETAYHKNIGPEKKTAICAKYEGKESCLICETQKQLYSTKEKDDAASAKEMAYKVRIYWNIVDLKENDPKKKDPKGVQIMMTGTDVLDQVLKYCANPKYGDLTNPLTGRNITMIFTPGEQTKSGFNEYDIQPDPDRTPIENPAWLEQMTDLKSLVKITEREELEVLLWGKEAAVNPPKEEGKKSFASTPTPAEKPVVAAKACMGKFDATDSECIVCILKDPCAEQRKIKQSVGTTTIASAPIALVPKDEEVKAETIYIPVINSQTEIQNMLKVIAEKHKKASA